MFVITIILLRLGHENVRELPRGFAGAHRVPLVAWGGRYASRAIEQHRSTVYLVGVRIHACYNAGGRRPSHAVVSPEGGFEHDWV